LFKDKICCFCTIIVCNCFFCIEVALLYQLLRNGIPAFIFLVISPAWGHLTPLHDPQEIPTNQIIIKYKTQTSPFTAAAKTNQILRLNKATGMQLRYLRGMSGNSHVMVLPQSMPIQEVEVISQRMMDLPDVEYAEPDYILQPTLIPNDPLYPTQWNYSTSWGINLPSAWEVNKGSSNIVVAVIDTGITHHADLTGRTVPGYDFISNVNIGNDGNGRDNDASDPGDWISESDIALPLFRNCQQRNSSWHGTHVSGTIGAKSDNGLGVVGVNWNSKIQPVRVLGKCGGYASDVIDGMRWAAGLPVNGIPNNKTPAKVLNLSLGGSIPCNSTFQTAINEINAKGAVMVVAAGNSNQNASQFLPASCKGVIAVAATDRFGNRAYYSNYGTVVAISAPGGAQSFANDPEGILSTLNTGAKVPQADTYVNYQGTSMATPHISGVVSLLLSRNPNLTYTQILKLLQSKAKPFPANSECLLIGCGPGIANTAASLAAVPPAVSYLTSYGTHDGMVLEFTENSNTGNSIFTTPTAFFLGDDSTNRQYRAILSFNTSELPDNAIVTKATLKIKTFGLQGSNPFNTHGNLLADIREFYFGNQPILEKKDFQSPANMLTAAVFNTAPINSWYHAIVETTALQWINRQGPTQMRLRFKEDDNNDFNADFVRFYSGDSISANRPQLIIEYYLP
jgi:serine protease